jgi:hypothetical protein
MPDKDRLGDIVERCRAELHPALSAEIVGELARIEVQFQFAGDDRTAAHKEIRAAISAALPLERADEVKT